ncbi:hypothetical protein [Bradyrhizobium sp. I1.14.4]|uniref:hypothetical protein n=1 Tax=unclassified Bradyrhizobium TaxID=2631580 RepID=UPI003D233422
MASADEYRPSEFFSLDLSRAVLSPKPLGPPAQFEPVPVEANTDHTPDQHANVEPQVEEPKVEQSKVERRKAVQTTRVTAPHERKRAVAHVPARAKLARRHSNPLNAEARDTRIQTWPCRTGGICNWRR